eukprot:5998551-Pyramimonas_sp.AAC.1
MFRFDNNAAGAVRGRHDGEAPLGHAGPPLAGQRQLCDGKRSKSTKSTCARGGRGGRAAGRRRPAGGGQAIRGA